MSMVQIPHTQPQTIEINVLRIALLVGGSFYSHSPKLSNTSHYSKWLLQPLGIMPIHFSDSLYWQRESYAHNGNSLFCQQI